MRNYLIHKQAVVVTNSTPASTLLELTPGYTYQVWISTFTTGTIDLKYTLTKNAVTKTHTVVTAAAANGYVGSFVAMTESLELVPTGVTGTAFVEIVAIKTVANATDGYV